MATFNPTNLGGGFQGIAPKIVLPTMDKSIVPRDRKVMRKAFATGYVFDGSYVMTGNFAQTPFRLAMNAGDPDSRQTAPGGSNQVKGRVGSMASVLVNGMDSTMPGNGATGNQHYVYDSSVYTKYKKIAGKNKNYNDKSFGGSNNGAFVAWMAVRR